MANSYYENQPIPQNTLPQQNTETENETTLPKTTPDNTDNLSTENTNNGNTFPDNSTGNLRVGVTTLNQLLPVAGAAVTVSSSTTEGENTTLDSSITDRSGNSKTFTLPAPSASFSQEPTTLLPFAIYTVSVTHPDYYNFLAENVQVFGGITTQLPVALIPLPELTDGSRTEIVVIPKQNL